MNSWLISGIIGGTIAFIVCAYVSATAARRHQGRELKYGWFVVGVGIGCLSLVCLATSAFFFDDDIWIGSGEFIAVVLLIVGFGIGAAYSFGEAFFVKGSFDDETIFFYTPWTGEKNERWDDLINAEFNSTANWYVLTFRSGKRIRLSNLLGGHGNILEILRKKGFDF